MWFWHFLSTRFGRPVCELKATMPYAEFVSQLAFYQNYPWGDDWRQTQALHATILSASPKYRHFRLDPYFPKPKRQSSNLVGLFNALKQAALEKQHGPVRQPH